jgi:hypothetical protein
LLNVRNSPGEKVFLTERDYRRGGILLTRESITDVLTAACGLGIVASRLCVTDFRDATPQGLLFRSRTAQASERRERGQDSAHLA